MVKKLIAICILLLSTQLSAEGRYVVAIHGLTASSLSMKPVCRQLTCSGDQVYLWDYPSTEGTICSHARELMEVLECIAAQRPEQPIDFITHSIGALILRQTLNIEGCPEEAKIGRTVMFAPPNQGSSLAQKWKGFPPVRWCIGTKIGCELMTYNAATIHSIGPFPETMDVLVIAGCRGNKMFFDEPNDGFLTINETALDTPYYFWSFPANHGRILVYPDALELMTCFINEGGSKPEESETPPEPTE